MNTKMTFQEIFKEPGLYVADSFAKGVAFEVNKDFELHTVTYKDKDDIMPEKHATVVYANLFKKEYKKVYTRNKLF